MPVANPALLIDLVGVNRLGRRLTLSPTLPRYDHTEVVVGSTIMLGILLVVALVALAIIWSRRGR
jgi:hypothetical protein